MASWGHHLIVNAGKCSPKRIRCAGVIWDFSDKLVQKINMVPYGIPQIIMFGEGNKKGFTLVQLIETSNICAHFVEETNDMYLDVFSCKDFDAETALSVVDEFFAPQYLEHHKLVRQAPHHQ